MEDFWNLAHCKTALWLLSDAVTVTTVTNMPLLGICINKALVKFEHIYLQIKGYSISQRQLP